MTGLEVKLHWDDGLCVVAMVGEARLETVGEFDAVATQIQERGVTKVIVDMTRLSFMDSAATGSLLRMHTRLTAAGGKVVLFGLQRMIQRLFDRLGLSELLIVADEAAAVAAFA